MRYIFDFYDFVHTFEQHPPKINPLITSRFAHAGTVLCKTPLTTEVVGVSDGSFRRMSVVFSFNVRSPSRLPSVLVDHRSLSTTDFDASSILLAEVEYVVCASL